MSIKDNQPSDGIRLSMMFPTFLGEAKYTNFILEKERLLSRLYRIRDEDEDGRRISQMQYAYGYTSFFTLNTLQNDPAFFSLTSFIQISADTFAQAQGWDVNRFQPVMSSLWCNINDQFSYHAEHLHPFSHISGVFYLNCREDSGDILFKDPRPGRMMVPPPVAQHRSENSILVKIKPEEGKLLMFPSFLEHSVAQNRFDSERVSMSFNFEMRPRTP